MSRCVGHLMHWFGWSY